MIKQAFGLVLVLCFAAHASTISELRQTKSGEELARFIYKLATQDVHLNELLEGVHSSEKLNIPSYSIEIPIKEIYGTIVYERFADELGGDFHQCGKMYRVREICSFRDAQNLVWRFHIFIFDQRQYRIIERFLKTEFKKQKLEKF